MRNTYMLAALLLGILFFTGCQNTANTIENANQRANVQHVADRRFITDPFLRDRLGVRRIIEGETQTGIMQVPLEVINLRTGVVDQAITGITGENPYTVEYKFTWFDDRGMEISNLNSGWKRITIIPGQITQIKGVAPDIYCKDFQISLKEVD